MQPILYRITPADPAAHLFEVVCTVPEPDPQGQVLHLPAWIPGSYMIRDFARNIVSMQAESDGSTLAIEAISKQSWRCQPCNKALTVTYQVYAWDLSVRAAHLDQTHAYFNGTSVFVAVQGQEDRACEVDIRPPVGVDYQHWRVATAMRPAGASLHGFGTYQADNYDELIDHPVEIGDLTIETFEVAGVPHDIAIYGRHRADMGRLCHDLKIICEHHVRLFGELPAMQRYVFLIMVVGEGYGGLEHRASCSLLCSRGNLPFAGETEVSESYRAFLGLCSHEYFHTWNVKRIKPDVFLPYDLSAESYTHLLWMFEGITAYYDDLSLTRCGLISPASYLEILGQTITRVHQGSGRQKQSVWDSSFYAWTKFYQQAENGPNAIVSYYTKGSLIALGLDILIRERTAGHASLDDVMRYCWREYGQNGKGVNEKTIEQEISDLVGVPLDDFFARYLRGTEELPLQDWFNDVGVTLTWRAPQSSQDKGGKPVNDNRHQHAWLGARISAEAAGVRLIQVLDNGIAQQAGMSAGDLVIAVDGLRVNDQLLEQMVARYQPNELFRVHAFRRDELMEFECIAKPAEQNVCVLTLQADTPLWLQEPS